MKKYLFGVIILAFISSLLFSCSKDEDRHNVNSMKGVWVDGITSDTSDEIFDLLITDNVWLWNPNASTLMPYINSSFEELAKRFAPDDEFWVYRYDSNNDAYLLYESYEFINGTLYFKANCFDVAKIKVSGNQMDITLYDIDFNPNYPDKEEPYPYITVSYDEIMSNVQFGTLPKGTILEDPEFITYSRYNK